MWHSNLDLYFCIFKPISPETTNGLTVRDANRRGTLDSWRSSNTGILHSSHWEQTINMSLRVSQNQCLVKSITNDHITIQHFAFFFHYWRCGTYNECRVVLLLTLNIIIIILSKINDRTFWSSCWGSRLGGSGSCSLVVWKKNRNFAEIHY